MRKLLLLRPEPGLSASVARAKGLGLSVIACPLFKVEPLAWQVPDPAGYDALLLTSANAVRQAGPGLGRLRALPVHAVGAATAAEAAAAGLHVSSVGTSSAAELLATLPAGLRLLHLGGEQVSEGVARLDRRIVYRSAEIAQPELPPLAGLVAVVHSPRSGQRLSELADTRADTRIAAISAPAAEACGTGWQTIAVASSPDDERLLALAAELCHTPEL